jgi:hypothetical protein
VGRGAVGEIGATDAFSFVFTLAAAVVVVVAETFALFVLLFAL